MTGRNFLSGIDNQDSKTKLYDKLEEFYDQPHRYYHTRRHIDALMILLVKYLDEIDDPVVVYWSILYHDAVYDPLLKTNEELSAQMALEDLTGLLKPERVDKIVSFIEDTATHNPCDDDSDRLLFLDMDMSILGSSLESYVKYAEAVRKEFSAVPDEQYVQGRVNVLSTFLERDKIYFHSLMAEKFEDKARENIRSEIERFTFES